MSAGRADLELRVLNSIVNDGNLLGLGVDGDNEASSYFESAVDVAGGVEAVVTNLAKALG